MTRKETDAAIRKGLAPYGYTLTSSRVLVDAHGWPTGAHVRIKFGRLHVTNKAGVLLWSSPMNKLGNFLEGYWHARPITV